MTWIFAEDFEGIAEEATLCINLAHASSIERENSSVFIICWPMVNSDFGKSIINLPFTTPEQAQAAYEKIKGMLHGV